MITEVTLENFKSIKELKGLKLKPLTLFTGKNSSGKSNILEGIALFGEASRLRRQPSGNPTTLDSIYNQSDFKRYPTHQVNDFITYRKKHSLRVTLEVMMNLDDNTKAKVKSLCKRLSFERLSKLERARSVGYYFQFKSQNKSFAQGINYDNDNLIAVSKRGNRQTEIGIPEESVGVQTSGNAEAFFDTNVFKPLASDQERKALSNAIIARTILNSLKNRFERVFLISGERGTLESELRVYDIPSPSWVGYRGQHVIEVLTRILVREPTKAEKIKEWANRFQLPDIRAGYVGESKLEADFKDQELGVGLNSVLAGLGARQVLSIIVQIFSTRRDSVIMIEEPEISLHPEHQVLLHELFATAVAQGKQIICTTHSPFLILALSRIVRKKMLPVEDIAVYHVEKDNKGTKVKELALDKCGFLKGGIPSFMKTEHELFQEWSEALEED